MLETTREVEGYDGIYEGDRTPVHPSPAWTEHGWGIYEPGYLERVLGDALGYMEFKGYLHNGYKWWFAAWGEGAKEKWTTREHVGQVPLPVQLVYSDFIVFGLESPSGRVEYRARVGGLDL